MIQFKELLLIGSLVWIVLFLIIPEAIKFFLILITLSRKYVNLLKKVIKHLNKVHYKL